MPPNPKPSSDDEIKLVRPGKWTLIVVSLLRSQPLRFNELKRDLGGISQKVLTTTLRELERDGFVTRTIFATIPPRVDYELTPIGRELLVLADALRVFATRNRDQVERARLLYDSQGGIAAEVADVSLKQGRPRSAS